MEIKGMVHCFFEQSGTFKNEFIKLGIPAEDYDIQNNFGETDHVIDLFAEIEKAWGGEKSIFDTITKDDLIMAFFPCIYFCATSQMLMSFGAVNYRCLDGKQTAHEIIVRSHNRETFYQRMIKMFGITKSMGLQMIVENPWSMQTYLKANFTPPTIVDNNRMMRGDYFKKPTAYWFINCIPTNGKTIQNNKEQRIIMNTKKGNQAGVCSEDRSMIHPDYARNFICDFILGKPQKHSQLSIFE